MRSTSAFTIASPMPVPWMPSCSRPSRLKGSNRWRICRSVMPRPVSATRTSTCVPRRSASTRTRPPSRLYLMALPIRFSRIWRSRVASASGTPSSVPVSSCTPRSRSSGSSSGSVSVSSGCSGTGCSAIFISPPSRLDRSSTSLISSSRCSPAPRMCSSRRRRFSAPASVPASSASSSCAKPSTAFSGVRSSWLMRARNLLLAWLSRCAISRSWRTASAVRLSVMSQLTPTRRTSRPSSSRTAIEREAIQRTRPSGVTMRNSWFASPSWDSRLLL